MLDVRRSHLKAFGREPVDGEGRSFLAPLIVLFFFDTVTLANFALADAMRLLVDRYGQQAVLTPDVLSEVENGIAAGREKLEIVEALVADNQLTLIHPSARERRLKVHLLRHLGAGEASCIACAVDRAATVVTDDRAARATCADYRISVTGTIGILLAWVREGRLSDNEADEVLAKMVEQGFYSPVSSISCLH